MITMVKTKINKPFISKMITMVNRIQILGQLKKYPVFTVKTVSDIIQKEKNYAKLVVYRLKKAGLIFEVERDKYTLFPDPWIVGSRIVWPSYISGWAALQYHHLTEQLPWAVDVITTRTRKKNEIKLARGGIHFIKTQPQYLFGFDRIHYQGYEIFMASKEKGIADAFVFKLVSPEELLEIIQRNKKDLNLKLVARYIRKMIRKPWKKSAQKFLQGIDTHA